MGFFKDAVTQGIDFVREEVMPLRYDLVKAGILSPDRGAYDPKSNLTDPTNYGTMNFGYKEKWALLDYSKCRAISYADSIIAAIMQLRINQIASFSIPQSDKYKVGFKIKMRDKDKEPNSAEQAKIKELEQFILMTGVPENFIDTPERTRRDGFATFLRKIGRDTLTFDQTNFEITPRNNGIPYQFQAVDAATIRIVPDEKEKHEYFGGAPNYTSEEFAQVMPFSGTPNPFREFQPKHPRYCQVVSGVIRHIYDEWEMAFGVRNPRTDLLAQGYGFSEIEMLVTTITSHMNAEAFNRRIFTNGSTVKGIMAFEGIVPPDQLESFRRQWYMQSTGITNAWKTPIMSLGKETKLNWVDLAKTNREMEFGKWLEYCIKSICGVFQLDPIEIGFDIARQTSGSSGGSGGLQGSNEKEKIFASQEKGLRPLLKHIQQLLNDYIVYRIDPDFEFEFVGLNVSNEKDDLDLSIQQVKNFKTVNELRAEHDLQPIPDFDAIKTPGDLILDTTWVTSWAQSKQAEMPGGGVPGMPGEEGGENGEGDANGPPGRSGSDPDAEEEPDYEGMTTEELQAELEKLEGQATKKSLELEL
jgi:hypothetical protein